jgi:hypothetical protein
VTEPTGLDYHEAYKAMYPGLVSQGIRLQDTQDSVLKTVDRAARLRRAERDRVKLPFSALATALEIEEIGSTTPGVLGDVAERIRKTIEEIR